MHVLETVQKDPRFQSRKAAAEQALDDGLMTPRAAASELWTDIVNDSPGLPLSSPEECLTLLRNNGS